MKLTLFLDFDGVLHPENCVRDKGGVRIEGYPGRSLFDRLPLLVEALRPHPEIQIVLSTTWVKMVGFNKAKLRLGELSERVIGTTQQEDRLGRLQRGSQVEVFAKDNKLNWVALDDDDSGWREWDRLVLCPPDGLNQEKVAELVEKIERWEK